MPTPTGTHLAAALRTLTADPFTQSAILRLHADAPHLLDAVTVRYLDAAIVTDNHAAAEAKAADQ